MKKALKSITVVGLVIMLASIMIAGVPVYANNINVTIDGSRVNFAGQPPVNVDGRTLVPVRGVFEMLGFDVGWNPNNQQITLTRATHTVVITVGSATFTANGANHSLDVPAQIIGGSTMLPIRAVVESVGYSVDWNNSTSTVVISTGNASSSATQQEATIRIIHADSLDRYSGVFTREQFINGIRNGEEIISWGYAQAGFVFSREDLLNLGNATRVYSAAQLFDYASGREMRFYFDHEEKGLYYYVVFTGELSS
ncbi:MAG: copper amine oxidase N-terminal domain-containing protein, partial [Defluviitaleaceae bacterium]|nr:copper amine oxidase N-terminal domain-containing protein [Defluviitaleaceae bacterium]